MSPSTASQQTSFPLELIQLKIQADQILQDITINYNEKWPERLSKFIITLMTHFNHAFVSQYTILYKTYMILTAFLLTILCNFFQVRIYGHEINPNPSPGWLQFFAMILPLKGKFSIVFFQLMFVTSLQIVYENILELHYRFTKKSTKLFTSKNFGPPKSSSQPQNHKPEKQRAKLSLKKCTHYLTVRKDSNPLQYVFCKADSEKTIVTPELEHWESNQILTSLLELFHGFKLVQDRQESRISIDFKSREFTYQPLLSGTKFLYVFSLIYAENMIWEGIIVKQWGQKMLHLAILGSCVAEFIIWNMINMVMESGQCVTFGGKNFLEISSQGDISLGMY